MVFNENRISLRKEIYFYSIGIMKELYEKPQTYLLAVRFEGTLCVSGDPGDPFDDDNTYEGGDL